MEKQFVVNPYNGILVSNKKKLLKHAVTQMNLKSTMLSARNQIHKHYVWFNSSNNLGKLEPNQISDRQGLEVGEGEL